MQIKGEKVVIKSIEESDLNNIQKLWNNGEVMKWVNFPNGLDITLEQLKKWYDSITKSSTSNEFVVNSKDNLFCGEVFYNKDIEHNRAGLDIKLLPQYHGKGFAKEALQLLIDYIFENEEEINFLWTEPSKANISARNLYIKCGLVSKQRPDDMEPLESYWEVTRLEWKLRKVEKDI